MPSERETFFIGTCVRVSDAAAFLEVRMQRHGTTMRDVSGSSRLLFPPRGEVELADAAGSLHVGDWVAFHVVSEAPQGASVLRVTGYRRLLPVEDASEFGSAESARRSLVEDGRADGIPGEVMVRIGDDEMVRVRIARDEDGRWRPVPGEEMRRLPIWRFDPRICLSVPAEPDPVMLIDPNGRFMQIGTVDWSRDADFVRRIIRSLTRAESGEDTALRQFAEALGRFADTLEQRTAPQSVDARVAHEILRMRNLGTILREQQDVLGEYYDLLRDDPEIKSLLKTKVEQIAQQMVESQRKVLLEELSAQLDRDLAAQRAEREADIRSSAERLGVEMARDIERRRADGLAQLEADMAAHERRGREELEASLGGKRAELETEVARLEDQRGTLFKQVELLGQRERDLSAAIDALSTKETGILESLALLQSRREAEIKKSIEALSAQMTAELDRRIATRAAELEVELAERERQGRETLHFSLETRRVELESAVAQLDDRKLVLGNTIEILERRERELTASIDGLSFKEASALEAIELRRAEREADVKRSVETLSTGMLADLERRVAARTVELEAEFADRERQGLDALETSLGTKRGALESEVAAFEDRRAALGREIAVLEQRVRELTSSAEGLAEREAAVMAAVEQRGAEREAEIKKSVEELNARMIADVERRIEARSAEFEAGLAERERQAHEALEAALTEKRLAFETEAASLDTQRISLGKEIETLQQRRNQLAASIDGLAAREARDLQALEQRRTQREADIKKSVEDLSAGMIGDLERRLAARSAEFEAGLADRERQARESLQASLGARRDELRSQVASLQERHEILIREVEQLQHKERALAASLEDLSSREASAVQSVAKLSRRILEEAPTPGRESASPTGT